MSGLLTRRQQLTLALAAATGAEYLDNNAIKPGWAVIIAALVPHIHMSDGSQCIVGSLLREGFINGIEQALVDEGNGFGEYIEAHQLDDGANGFNLPKDYFRRNLDEGGNMWTGTESGPIWSALLEAWSAEAHARVTMEDIEAMIPTVATQLSAVQGEADFEYDAVCTAYADAKQATLKAEQVRDEAQTALDDAETAYQEAEEARQEAYDARNEARDARERTSGRQRHLQHLADGLNALKAQQALPLIFRPQD